MTNPTDNKAQDVATQIAKVAPPTGGPLQLSNKFQPLTDDQAWALATRIKTSNIIPKDFIGKPENIFIAILMGREVGLPAIQAVQNIMVVNGRPCMWGDSLPALVYASNKCAKFEEEIDENGKWARCTVRRVGDQKDHVQTFTWADAQKAGYDKKPGPWQTNPKRMLQMRARAFALRDKFADVLKGLGMVEEAQDYEMGVAAKEPMPMPKRASERVTEAQVINVQAEHENQAAQETPEAPQTVPENVDPQTGEILSDEQLAASMAGDAQEPAEDEPTITIDDRKELLVLSKRHNKPPAEMQKYLFDQFGINSSAELPKSKLDQVKNWIQGKLV